MQVPDVFFACGAPKLGSTGAPTLPHPAQANLGVPSALLSFFVFPFSRPESYTLPYALDYT
eukprot:3884370-Prymnesium_polylepis.1